MYINDSPSYAYVASEKQALTYNKLACKLI